MAPRHPQPRGDGHGGIDSVARWAASGLAALTGEATGPADLSRAPILDCAAATLAAFDAEIAMWNGGRTRIGDESAATLLSGRAALTGARRSGRVSVGGGTRLVQAADRWLALSLTRPDDVDLVPALLCSSPPQGREWDAIAVAAAESSAQEMVDRARMLGLAAAVLGDTAPRSPIARHRGSRTAPRGPDGLLVVDLSALWAGPLATRLLADVGAVVVKVESAGRRDGARDGSPDFFGWMNHGKLSYRADLSRGRDELAALIEVADVVVEASRPRGLHRHGLAAAQLRTRPGQVWLRITGHGTDGTCADRIGYGDDAAVSGGLVGTGRGGPVFCGDAIADPLTGLESARLIVDALGRGGGVEIDIDLASTAARHAAAGRAPIVAHQPVSRPPVAPLVRGPGPPLGADDSRVAAIVADRIRAAHESAL
ncbi:CoA transferase [Gordonia soli]|uniref:CoA-transferase n=1 Tax=Gordonia soli NBRC 108243 TaxID=1223545 RepID=M0QHS1_9ACTN|nr:CoA transferase [Gordonia soli]GAC68190.1 hypothetical protein GS4_14_00190 [Gordonia soli NBRC 108243]